MLNLVVQNTVRFIILVLVQVLVVKNIELGRYIHPFLYTLYVLILPFETPKGVLLLTAFLLGIIMDMFYNTAGMHAAACVLMAFARPGVLKLIAPRDGYEVGAKPTLRYMGPSWYLSYSSSLIIVHHLFLFYVESFKFSEFFVTLATVLLSSIFTLILVIITQYLFYNKKE